MDIYLSRDNQSFGPYTPDDIIAYLKDGSVSFVDSAWHDGAPGWIPVSSLPFIPQEPRRIPPPPPVSNPPPSVETETTTYAGFGRRVGGFLIDVIVVGILTFGMAFILGAVTGGFGGSSPETLNMIGNILSLVVFWLYFARSESSQSQTTVGKKVFGLIVTDLNGDRITFLRASARVLGLFLSNMTIGLGYLVGLFTSKKQGLQDLVAGCVVVRRRMSVEDRHTSDAIVADLVMGVNKRKGDNIFQGITILITTAICAFLGYSSASAETWEHTQGLGYGALIGLIIGVLFSGLALFVYRALRHAKGQHD